VDRAELFQGSGWTRPPTKACSWFGSTKWQNQWGLSVSAPDHVQHLIAAALRGSGLRKNRAATVENRKCLFDPRRSVMSGQYRAALTAAVVGGYRLDVHPQWRALLWTDRQNRRLVWPGSRILFSSRALKAGDTQGRRKEAEAAPTRRERSSPSRRAPERFHPPDRPVRHRVSRSRWGAKSSEVGVTFNRPS